MNGAVVMPTPPLDDDEIALLHEMIRDFDRAKWLRGQLKVWLMWVAGLPALILGVWTAVIELMKLWKAP